MSYIDQQVQAYLISRHEAGGIVDTSIATAAALVIIRQHDSNVATNNGICKEQVY